MAYTGEAKALHLLVSAFFGSTEIKDVVGGMVRKTVTRAKRMAGGHLTPRSRPVREIDSAIEIESLDPSGVVSESAAAASITLNYVDGAGGTPQIVFSNHVANGFTAAQEYNEKGLSQRQEFVLEDTAYSRSVSI